MTEKNQLAEYIGKEVVVDTNTPYVYLGTLEACAGSFFTLRNVDVHDMAESRSTKELYIMNVRRRGIQPNRAAVKIRQDVTVSVSLLSDVILFD
ncbi:MAG: hypothetical protein HQ592_09475 [Planctomycetes bacterium]|jgi:hypothetical protein|nr:hypothetical protein [Planctomycetota bacterium]